jgi:hypothetical protein
MSPSSQVRTVIACLLLVVATLVVVVPSAGLWEPPLDASFAAHVFDGNDPAAAQLTDGAGSGDSLPAGQSAAHQDPGHDDRPSTPIEALQRSDSLSHWVLLSIAALAALLLAPRASVGRWSPVRTDDRARRSPLLRGFRAWRAPPVLV